MQTDEGRKHKHDEANNLFSQFCGRVRSEVGRFHPFTGLEGP